jgi:hypothetical protein
MKVYYLVMDLMNTPIVSSKKPPVVEVMIDMTFDESNGSQVEQVDKNLVDEEEQPSLSIMRMGLGKVRSREAHAKTPVEERNNDSSSATRVEPPGSQQPQDQSQAHGDNQVHGIGQGGEQGGKTQVDAPQVEDDDDGPIQPKSQVPHPRVHQSIQRDHLVDNILGSIQRGVTTRSHLATFCGYPSSDSEATEEASPIAHLIGKRKVVAKVPLHSHGCERPNPQGTSGQAAHPCIKRDSAPGSHMADAGESLEYLERIIIRMEAPIRQTDPLYNGIHPVDCTKGKHDLYAKRYDDPSRYNKEQQGDVHFLLNFYVDWYDSVILCKSHPTTEMKSINWDYLGNVDLPVVREVKDVCRRKNVSTIIFQL